MARSGHTGGQRPRPLLGVKQTYRLGLGMSANDPKRTSVLAKVN